MTIAVRSLDPSTITTVVNHAGSRYEEWRGAVEDALRDLVLHVPPDAAGGTLFAAQIAEQLDGRLHGSDRLREVRLVSARTARSAASASESRWTRGEARAGAIDEWLAAYFQCSAVIELKVDRIRAAARRLACDPLALLRVVLRHELGHHLAPLNDMELGAYGRRETNSSTCRAETAAQLFAWLTSSQDECAILRKLSELQGPAYRMFEHFLPLQGLPGASLITAWQLCEALDLLMLSTGAWSGLARVLEYILGLVSRRPQESVWPTLEVLAQVRIEDLVDANVLPVGMPAPRHRARQYLDLMAFHAGCFDPPVASLHEEARWTNKGGIAIAALERWPDFSTLFFCVIASDRMKEQCEVLAARKRWLVERFGTSASHLHNFASDRTVLIEAHDALRTALDRAGYPAGHVGPAESPCANRFPFGGFQVQVGDADDPSRTAELCFGVAEKPSPAYNAVMRPGSGTRPTIDVASFRFRAATDGQLAAWIGASAGQACDLLESGVHSDCTGSN